MGKPQKLTHIKDGLAIGAKEHKGLGETLNWVIDFCNNLCGDNNYITVDNPLGDCPQIRWNGDLHVDYANGGDSEGGGGECECDVTPYYSEGTDNVKIATWTNGTTTKDIYSPTNNSDVLTMYGYMSNTPFWLDIASKKIKNCYFYDGRQFVHLDDFPITQGGLMAFGTYYLRIQVDEYGNRNYSITVNLSQKTMPTGMYPVGGYTIDEKDKKDSITYYRLWTISPTLVFDWRLTWKMPFYNGDIIDGENDNN